MFGFFRRSAPEKEISKSKSELDDRFHAAIDAAFRGNADAAQWLAITLPNEKVGAFVLRAFNGKMPLESYQVLVNDAWSMNDGSISLACGHNAKIIRNLIKAAAFKLTDLPAEFPIYRGEKFRNRPKFIPRISWTKDRDTACWFATTFSIDPIVMKATARREEVIFYSEGRNEYEVVLDREKSWVEDGSESDWRNAASRHMESLAEHNLALREKLRAATGQ